MAFSGIKKELAAWLAKKNLSGQLEKRQIINLANQYFQEKKDYENLAKAVNFCQGNLIVECAKGIITSELRWREEEIKKYLEEKISRKIKRIIFK